MVNALRKCFLNLTSERGEILTEHVIKKFIGSTCTIIAGTLSTNLEGKIVDVDERWIEVETGRGMELINLDTVHSIRMVKDNS